jgi:hypothetical protein
VFERLLPVLALVTEPETVGNLHPTPLRVPLAAKGAVSCAFENRGTYEGGVKTSFVSTSMYLELQNHPRELIRHLSSLTIDIKIHRRLYTVQYDGKLFP